MWQYPRDLWAEHSLEADTLDSEKSGVLIFNYRPKLD